jgi:hypothetical protein
MLYSTWVQTLTFVSRQGPIDLEAKFQPNLLNTAIYLLGLSQQVSTFVINFQVGTHVEVLSLQSDPCHRVNRFVRTLEKIPL